MSYIVRSALMIAATMSFLCCSKSAIAQVRDRAIVNLTFDDLPDAAAATADSAQIGKVPDTATLSGQPSRIHSAFVNGSAGYSLMLDPSRKQQLFLPNSEDTSRPDAVTVSGLFASLQPLSSATYHGLFAKRKTEPGNNTNYGINFTPASDVLQVYVNDGTGFKAAHYSAKATIGYRRRVQLTMCMDNGDAPAADADADADDLRVRFFVNGQAATPTAATGGLVDGNVAWLQDVTLAKCVSDTPFTIGSSFTDGELTRLICDDVCLFSESLSDDDVKTLFTELAGASAAEITAEQGGGGETAAMQPAIARVTPHAMGIGKTTRVTVDGQYLEGAKLHCEVAGLAAAGAEGSSAGQAVFDIAVDPAVIPGRYLVRCVTTNGVSNPLVIAIDGLSTHVDSTFTEASPATAFPVAAAGVISGTEQKRLWFKGTANQRVVAEVEARRVGSKLDPVVEIRTQSGTPLAIQWQQSDLNGDARTVATLPADGLYFAEVHDLQFQAPGASPWRMIVGDLPPSSLAFPTMLTSAGGSILTLGRDAVSEPVVFKGTNGRLTIESGSPLLPLPALRTMPGAEITEPVEGIFPATPVDATFTTAPFSPLMINGRISAAKEQDSVLLTVTPGQTLHFSASARQIHSPLRAHLSLLNGDAIVAQNDGESGASDPSFSFVVPDAVTQLKVQIRDVTGKGSPAAAYRLLVGRADRIAFVLSSDDSSVRLPVNGSVPVVMNIVRQSPVFRYTGPIHLSLTGAPGISVIPDTLPASEQAQEIHFVMLTRTAEVTAESIAEGQGLTIEGRADGPDPAFSTTARLKIDSVPGDALTISDNAIVAGSAESISATVLLDAAPPVLLRGITTQLPVRVVPLTEQGRALARFELKTTEPDRREDPNKPDSALKPKVSLAEFQFGPVSQSRFPLTLQVPLDTPSATIDAVVSAEFVDQPLEATNGSKSWTAPISLFIDDALTLTSSAEPVKGTKTSTVVFSGLLQRHPLFSEPVTITLDGLPAGYAAAPVIVAPEQPEFAVSVTIPEAATAGEVPNLNLKVQQAGGNVISKPTVVRLIVE